MWRTTIRTNIGALRNAKSSIDEARLAKALLDRACKDLVDSTQGGNKRNAKVHGLTIILVSLLGYEVTAPLRDAAICALVAPGMSDASRRVGFLLAHQLRPGEGEGTRALGAITISVMALLGSSSTSQALALVFLANADLRDVSIICKANSDLVNTVASIFNSDSADPTVVRLAAKAALTLRRFIAASPGDILGPKKHPDLPRIIVHRVSLSLDLPAVPMVSPSMALMRALVSAQDEGGSSDVENEALVSVVLKLLDAASKNTTFPAHTYFKVGSPFIQLEALRLLGRLAKYAPSCADNVGEALLVVLNANATSNINANHRNITASLIIEATVASVAWERNAVAACDAVVALCQPTSSPRGACFQTLRASCVRILGSGGLAAAYLTAASGGSSEDDAARVSTLKSIWETALDNEDSYLRFVARRGLLELSAVAGEAGLLFCREIAEACRQKIVSKPRDGESSVLLEIQMLQATISEPTPASSREEKYRHQPSQVTIPSVISASTVRLAVPASIATPPSGRLVKRESVDQGGKGAVYIDVCEALDATFDGGGQVLFVESTGSIMVSASISGEQPVCSMKLNDGLSKQHVANIGAGALFHSCVTSNISSWASERAVTFTPLSSSKFEVLRYRIPSPGDSASAQLPCHLTFSFSGSSASDGGRCYRGELTVKRNPSFRGLLQSLIVSVPLPPNAFHVDVQERAGDGGRKSSATVNAKSLDWKISALGKEDARLVFEATTISHFVADGEEQAPNAMLPTEFDAANRMRCGWVPQPASLSFNTMPSSFSGVSVYWLKVTGGGENITKWVRYETHSGVIRVLPSPVTLGKDGEAPPSSIAGASTWELGISGMALPPVVATAVEHEHLKQRSPFPRLCNLLCIPFQAVQSGLFFCCLGCVLAANGQLHFGKPSTTASKSTAKEVALAAAARGAEQEATYRNLYKAQLKEVEALKTRVTTLEAALAESANGAGIELKNLDPFAVEVSQQIGDSASDFSQTFSPLVAVGTLDEDGFGETRHSEGAEWKEEECAELAIEEEGPRVDGRAASEQTHAIS